MKLLNLFRKDENEIVAEIHNEFDTAQERLLEQAKKILDSVKPIPEKAERLKALGFTNSEKVVMADAEKKKQMKSQEQAELIMYYKREYPFLKFLTESELDRICEKYNLIHAPVENYIKDVPEKNIKEIEDAQKLKKEDYGTEESDLIRAMRRMSLQMRLLEAVRFGRPDMVEFNKETPQDVKLYIAAPKSHFNLEGLKKKGRSWRPEPKDPIVFRYCRGGIQVLSKWGLEANDPMLQNETLN